MYIGSIQYTVLLLKQLTEFQLLIDNTFLLVKTVD
jgi:hypothetical protein